MAACVFGRVCTSFGRQTYAPELKDQAQNTAQTIENQEPRASWKAKNKDSLNLEPAENRK